MRDFVKLSEEQCKSWISETTGLSRPGAINVACPFCGFYASFSIINFDLNKATMVASAKSVCGNCDGFPKFVFVFGSLNNALNTSRPILMSMYPLSVPSYPMPELSEEIPVALRNSMAATVNSYNAKIYSASMTNSRRTLEGIFKYLVSDAKRNQSLVKLIETASDEIDFSEPLKRLSDAIRQGGNIGAHFDFDVEPEEKTARQMIELLDYLISYLYILPDRIERLENAISESKITKIGGND